MEKKDNWILNKIELESKEYWKSKYLEAFKNNDTQKTYDALQMISMIKGKNINTISKPHFLNPL